MFISNVFTSYTQGTKDCPTVIEHPIHESQITGSNRCGNRFNFQNPTDRICFPLEDNVDYLEDSTTIPRPVYQISYGRWPYYRCCGVIMFCPVTSILVSHLQTHVERDNGKQQSPLYNIGNRREFVSDKLDNFVPESTVVIGTNLAMNIKGKQYKIRHLIIIGCIKLERNICDTCTSI